MGKLAHPNNTEKLAFGVNIQIFTEKVDKFKVEQGVVDNEEAVDDEEADVLPFNPQEKPTLDKFLRFGSDRIPVDSTRVKRNFPFYHLAFNY